jgi:hypothetical protein
MIEIEEISRFFPLNSGIPEVTLFQDHHLYHLQKCLENKLYSSAYFHVHALFMLFVYLQLYRISNEFKEQFSYSLIGFASEERQLIDEQSPFSFWRIKEKTVFRFFRLINFDDGTIGNISSCIEKRNKHLHVNGELYCDTEEKMEKIMQEYENNMRKIVSKSNDFIRNLYLNVLSTANQEQGLQPDNDDIELNILIPGMLSQNEIEQIKLLKLADPFTEYLVTNF